jgi:probable phosphoglycerate mutase
VSTGEIVVVRHGQTDANARGLLLGRLDVDLDDVGRAQAEAVAAAVGPPDLVLSSPLARARQTAAAFGQEVEVVPDWIELDYGEWDGRPAGDVPADVWRAWRAEPDFTPPGGESLARLTLRVHAALDDLAARLDGRRAVVVTHVSPVKAAVAWALDVGPGLAWRTYVAPASITRLGVVDGRPTLRGFNEVLHLEGITPA